MIEDFELEDRRQRQLLENPELLEIENIDEDQGTEQEEEVGKSEKDLTAH